MDTTNDDEKKRIVEEFLATYAPIDAIRGNQVTGLDSSTSRQESPIHRTKRSRWNRHPSPPNQPMYRGASCAGSWLRQQDIPTDVPAAPAVDAVKTSKENRKSKYIVIGDGFMHDFMAQIAGGDKGAPLGAPELCVKQQTIEEAIGKVHRLDSSKCNMKKVIISIGSTDIQNGASLPEIAQRFVKLFLFCKESLHMKPIIVTLCDYQSAKVKVFNKFLLENFRNVVNIWQVFGHGLDMNLTNRTDCKKPSLSIDKKNQLILKQ